MESTSENPTNNITLAQILNALNQIQHENNLLQETVAQLQASQQPVPQPANNIRPRPKISLPEKFDGTRHRFRGFINQVRLVIQLHPDVYATEINQVGLIGTLLTGTALAWFAPLVEQSSPLLQDFDAFVSELEATFGESDKANVSANKIRTLRQGSRPASTYASEFRQLSSDLAWNEPALISQFRSGLRDDVKDLMLTMSDPITLSEAVAQAIRCDNRLFERRQEKKLFSSATPASPITAPFQKFPAPKPVFQQPSDVPVPMIIDGEQPRGPLTDTERLRRRTHKLCLYCGKPDHMVRACPIKPKVQIAQVQTGSENSETQLQ